MEERHLAFVDDVVLFCKANTKSFPTLEGILRAIGLMKFIIIGRRNRDDLRSHLEDKWKVNQKSDFGQLKLTIASLLGVFQ